MTKANITRLRIFVSLAAMLRRPARNIGTLRREVETWPRFFCLLALALLVAGPAQAHVSEQAFVLLLPTQAYIIGGCLSVLGSILVVSLMPKAALDRLFRPLTLGAWPWPARAADATSLLATAVFLALVVIGITGPRDPLTNLLPLVVWVGLWIILFNLVGLLGDVWYLLNPWRGLYHLIFGRDRTTPLLTLPAAWGIAPAIAGFAVLFGFSIVDPAPADPDRLAQFALLYWLFHLAAMAVFGSADWLARGEPLTLFFAQISRVAIFRHDDRLRAGLPCWQLAQLSRESAGPAVFALMILGLGSFDGLKETFWWLARIGINPLEFPGRSAVIVPSLAGMALAVAALLALFAVTAKAGQMLGNRGATGTATVGFRTMFCVFAPTILPIALAFHAAHFTLAFLVDGQYLLAALGDPLANGANLFGLGEMRVTTGFLNSMDSVRAIWLTQAGIVVAGHILAAASAHRRALALFGTARRAALSQIPLGLFMVAYTWFGLWLLAAPRGV